LSNCAYPENGVSLSPEIFNSNECTFHYSGFLSNCACPENRVALKFFTWLNILFTFRSFEQLALALKISLYGIYLLDSGFLSNLRLP